MDFEFSKEEKLWQWAVKDFCVRELVNLELTTFDQTFKKTLKKMAELGFLGVTLPERYDGDPASWILFGILLEEIAGVNPGFAYFILVSHEVAKSMDAFASEELKDHFLPGLIRGDTIGCIASTEQDAGCDFDAISTTVEGDNQGYRINGKKEPVSFGMVADIALTFARTDLAGPTAFVVPLSQTEITSIEPNIGLSVAAPASIQFNDALIPRQYQVGGLGSGRQIAFETGSLSSLNQVAIGLISLGIAQNALKLAIRYSKERHAFGKPIAKFEAISQKIAEDMTVIEAGKLLCYRTLSLKDRSMAHAKEAAMCGWWCPKISHQAIQDSLLIHGHSGYSDDHPFEQMLKDLVGFEMLSGTEQLLKLVAGNKILGPTGVPDCLLGFTSSY